MPTRPARTTATLLAPLALVLGACQEPAVPVAPQADVISGQGYPRITIEPALAPFAAVDYQSIIIDPPSERRPIGVITPIRSIAHEPFNIQYRYLWIDAAGRPLGDSGWTFQNMQPGLRTTLSGNSTTLDAADWQLEIRVSR